MRNMVRILTAGTLVFCLTIGVAYGDGTTTAPTLTAKVAQKAVAPGATFTATVDIANAPRVGALQFMMKVTGGESGTITVDRIDAAKNDPDYVFRSAQMVDAFDPQQKRLGLAVLNGTVSADSGMVATITFRVSDDASGTFSINFDKGQETLLRDADAGPMPLQFGKNVSVTVSNRTPSRIDKAKRQ